ncbi:AI-2E family transporter [Propioniciclava sinopodophylli]|uniref:AI-2E family transporter n=2 Tax=Propioniciclava sinopodophylli TaxID=1837344 RepID=A0A4Q9KCJ4_9ACTN|nr:AI-2E family transporter [Propioniciclava sinopodophylli]
MSLMPVLRRLLGPEPRPAEPIIVQVPVPAEPAEPKASLEPDIPRGVTVAAGYAWRLIFIGVAVYAVYRVLSFFSQITVPVGMAILLAAMLFPVTTQLKKWKWPPALAAIVSLLGLVIIVLGLLGFVGQQVAAEWPELLDQSREGFQALVAWLGTLPFGIDDARLNEWIAQGTAWLQGQASSLASAAASFGAAFGSFFAGLATALVAAFFFAYQGRRIFAGSVEVLVPKHYRAPVDRAALRGWTSLVAYMRSAVIVALVDAAGVALAALLLQVPLVAALFALTFFLSFIPIVGATVAGAVAVVLALVTHGWVSALIMLAAVIGVMQVESTFLQPLVMGSAVDLHPLAVLLGITAGGIISGILGALVAIPVLAFGVAFLRALRTPEPTVSV